MGYNYDIFQYTYAAGKSGKVSARNGLNAGDIPLLDYVEVLPRIRDIITAGYATEMREAVESDNGEEAMKGLIQRLLYQERLQVKDADDVTALTDRLYEDMFGFSVLTKYIKDPEVQEINANRWDDIECITRTAPRGFKIREHFNSPTQAADVAKRMAALGGLVLDAKTPRGDSYITEGVRIHVKIPPVIDDDAGVHFSIRKQRRELFTTQELINYGTATKLELDFLSLCIANGISIGYSGNTGSGKTTDIGYLCSTVPNDQRIYTIEDTRELELEEQNEDGGYVTRVMHTKTRYSDDPERNVSLAMLLRDALRCDPNLIVVSEMRGAEALTAIEAGRTGHTILSSFHANNAKDAYARLVSMAMMSDTRFTEDMLMRFACSAFPVICHKMKLSDGSRKYIEINEAIEREDGKFEISPLFKFIPTGTVYDDEGHVKEVQGKHVRINPCSDGLATKLLLYGAPLEEVQRFSRPDFDPLKNKTAKKGR